MHRDGSSKEVEYYLSNMYIMARFSIVMNKIFQHEQEKVKSWIIFSLNASLLFKLLFYLDPHIYEVDLELTKENISKV